MVKKIKHAVCPFCGHEIIGGTSSVKVIDEGRHVHHCDCGDRLYVVVSKYGIKIELAKE